jgi:hypothetical protein
MAIKKLLFIALLTITMPVQAQHHDEYILAFFFNQAVGTQFTNNRLWGFDYSGNIFFLSTGYSYQRDTGGRYYLGLNPIPFDDAGSGIFSVIWYSSKFEAGYIRNTHNYTIRLRTDFSYLLTLLYYDPDLGSDDFWLNFSTIGFFVEKQLGRHAGYTFGLNINISVWDVIFGTGRINNPYW